MMTLSGLSTAIKRRANLLRSARTLCSSSSNSVRLLNLVMPIVLQKSRIEADVYPRRRIPDKVGMRGSSQPSTISSLTSCSSLRLLITVFVRLRRANSICRGAQGTGQF